MSESSVITCALCGKPGARIRAGSRSYGKGQSLLVIEGVPFVACPACKETYLTSDTMHELQRIKDDQENYAIERNVKVAQYVITESRTRLAS